jgi:methionyl-tRNA synthetase
MSDETKIENKIEEKNNEQKKQSDVVQNVAVQNVDQNNIVTFNDWMKVELRVGKIEVVEDVVGKDKLYKFSVNFGEMGKRTILAGLKQYYTKEELLNKKTVFVFNLAPRPLAGSVSQGMILAAKTIEGKYKIVSIDDSVVEGTRLE